MIDEDQGRSGATATFRTGFQRLAAEVGLGKVGIVLMLEASRLARNNSDWYRLIEICGISGTLIADESAVYNPREPNDRLLLGVKGTLSEAELFTLRTRLYEGRWNKARKGLLRFPLPAGYVLAANGDWVLDPDTQVRERLSYVFDSFRRLGVVRAVVRDLRRQGLELPTRVTAKEAYGSLVWKAPTLSAVVRILHNPAYAGAYVYGRSEYFSERRSPKTGKASAHVRNVAQWPVRITGHHPAYIGWEEFVKNQEQLRQNWGHDESRGVPREGRALLQGIVYCGVCGRKMSVQNRAVKESRSPSYVCGRGYQDGDEQSCQCMTSRPIDAAVVEAFLTAVSPVNVRVATQVMNQIEQELISQRRQRELQLEQARYEARLAQRQYDAVDPFEPFGSSGVGAAMERKAGARDRTGACLCSGGTGCGMEVDSRGAGGNHGLVQRSTGNLERGNDNQPGAETITAYGDRIRAGGWEQPSGADRGADSLAFWHDNESQREAGCTWRMLAEDAGRSRFPDSQNGAAAHLRRNRRSTQSRRSAQRFWPALSPVSTSGISAGGTVLTERKPRSEVGNGATVISWWSSRKLNKRCFVFQVYSGPTAGDR